MSVFSFPRLHVKGLLIVNVGTGNNDDYSNLSYMGKPLRLADSIQVQPIDFNKDDATFVKWAQTRLKISPPDDGAVGMVNKGAGKAPDKFVIPGEWNYYGNMGLTMKDVRVISVQTGPDAFSSNHPFLGAELSFNNRPGPTGGSTAMLIDINPEGVPCSQVFADFLTLAGNDNKAIFSGKPSKAVTRWINFQRNSRLKGPPGAGAYFHCVVPIQQLQGQPILQLMSPPGALSPGGIVFRYYLSRSMQKINNFKYNEKDWLDQMEALYAKGQSGQSPYSDCINPTYIQLNGTIAPWYAGEMESVATGRLLGSANPVPGTCPPSLESGGNTSPPMYRLGPAVLQVNSDHSVASVDFVGTFPDQYQRNPDDPYNPLQTDNNPKMDFDSVSLVLRVDKQDKVRQQIPYTDLAEGDRRGWIFDVPLAGVTSKDLEDGSFVLTSVQTKKDALAETDLYIASDQSCIYGEQKGPGDSFRNQDPAEGPSTIRAFRKGQELSPANCPPLYVWQYAQVPNQDDFNAKLIISSYKPGQPLQVDTGQPGVFLFTFNTTGDASQMPDSNGLDLMSAPMVNLRMLPNEDYRQYYKNPESPEPVGNDQLTFEVIYKNVLRNYYLLYPGMNVVIPLNDGKRWQDPVMASLLLQHTQKSQWNQYGYMPRTRDLSESRRTLLQAFARKYINQ